MEGCSIDIEEKTNQHPGDNDDPDWKRKEIDVENDWLLCYCIARMIALPTRWGTLLICFAKMVDEPLFKIRSIRMYIFCKAVDEPLSRMPTISAVTALVWVWNGLVFFIFRRI